MVGLSKLHVLYIGLGLIAVGTLLEAYADVSVQIANPAAQATKPAIPAISSHHVGANFISPQNK